MSVASVSIRCLIVHRVLLCRILCEEWMEIDLWIDFSESPFQCRCSLNLSSIVSMIRSDLDSIPVCFLLM